MNRLTKKAVAEYVKTKLATDETWAKAALLKIYSYQTEEEQEMETTNRYNGVGFGGADVEILSSFAKQLQTKKWLSKKQMVILHKKISKYSRQIIQVSDQMKLEVLVKKSLNK